MTVEDIRALSSREWMMNKKERINFGYSESAFWLKISLISKDQQEYKKILEIAYAVLDHVDVYTYNQQQQLRNVQLGDKVPFHQRLIKQRNFLVPIDFQANQLIDVYIRLQSTSSIQAPVNLWNSKDYYQVDQGYLLGQGVYFGIALVMLLYNFFIYLATGEKNYIYYVGYTVCLPLFLASIDGLTFQYLWPEATIWNDRALVFFLNGMFFFGTLFSSSFLNINRQDHKQLKLFFDAMIALSSVMALMSIVLPYAVMIKPTAIFALVFCITLFSTGMYRWTQGYESARYYTVAWFCMLGGGAVLMLSKFTLVPHNQFTQHATQFGSALEIILLSIALAERLNTEKRKAFQAQNETIKVQGEAYLLLEQRVAERTHELTLANKSLEEYSSTDALTGLKNRAAFDTTYRRYFSSAYSDKTELSVIIIDIDFFKKFNDTYGHLVGDDCLVTVASCLKSVVTRPEDLNARYGGEEFVVVLPNTSIEGAKRVAERIRSLIATTPFKASGTTLYITVSLGIASVIPSDVDGQDTLFKKADDALYQAKEGGRNRVEISY